MAKVEIGQLQSYVQELEEKVKSLEGRIDALDDDRTRLNQLLEQDEEIGIRPGRCPVLSQGGEGLLREDGGKVYLLLCGPGPSDLIGEYEDGTWEVFEAAIRTGKYLEDH